MSEIETPLGALRVTRNGAIIPSTAELRDLIFEVRADGPAWVHPEGPVLDPETPEGLLALILARVSVPDDDALTEGWEVYFDPISRKRKRLLRGADGKFGRGVRAPSVTGKTSKKKPDPLSDVFPPRPDGGFDVVGIVDLRGPDGPYSRKGAAKAMRQSADNIREGMRSLFGRDRPIAWNGRLSVVDDAGFGAAGMKLESCSIRLAVSVLDADLLEMHGVKADPPEAYAAHTIVHEMFHAVSGRDKEGMSRLYDNILTERTFEEGVVEGMTYWWGPDVIRASPDALVSGEDFEDWVHWKRTRTNGEYYMMVAFLERNMRQAGMDPKDGFLQMIDVPIDERALWLAQRVVDNVALDEDLLDALSDHVHPMLAQAALYGDESVMRDGAQMFGFRMVDVVPMFVALREGPHDERYDRVAAAVAKIHGTDMYGDPL